MLRVWKTLALSPAYPLRFLGVQKFQRFVKSRLSLYQLFFAGKVIAHPISAPHSFSPVVFSWLHNLPSQTPQRNFN